jgi:hypothetical protein
MVHSGHCLPVSFLWMFAAVALPGCNLANRSDNESREQPSISDASVDVGSGAQPTNSLSFELMKDPAVRRLYFQQLLSSKERKCGLVSEAILQDGFEGTDNWRVTCTDSGKWLVTFSQGGTTEIANCTSGALCK